MVLHMMVVRSKPGLLLERPRGRNEMHPIYAESHYTVQSPSRRHRTGSQGHQRRLIACRGDACIYARNTVELSYMWMQSRSKGCKSFASLLYGDDALVTTSLTRPMIMHGMSSRGYVIAATLS